MSLRAVHYSLDRNEWTFEFEDGARLPTRDREMADRLCDEHQVPRNVNGARIANYIPPDAGMDVF
jgi:hypothetical protein